MGLITAIVTIIISIIFGIICFGVSLVVSSKLFFGLSISDLLDGNTDGLTDTQEAFWTMTQIACLIVGFWSCGKLSAFLDNLFIMIGMY